MLAHVHIMKTAGQTVCQILRRSFGANHCDLRCGDLATQHDVNFARRFYPRLISISGHSIRPWSDLAQLPEIRFYTFLRDPVGRCLSHYQFDRFRNRSDVNFLEWIEKRANYQTKFLCGQEDSSLAIEVLEERIGFVGLLEEFDRSLEALQQWSGYQLALNYRSRNVASDSSVKEQILANDEYKQALYDFNEVDQVVYRHAKESIFPRLMNEFETRSDSVLDLSPTVPLWPDMKRNVIYKPIAKLRHRLLQRAS